MLYGGTAQLGRWRREASRRPPTILLRPGGGDGSDVDREPLNRVAHPTSGQHYPLSITVLLTSPDIDNAKSHAKLGAVGELNPGRLQGRFEEH
jgi:hypothetical protein